MISYDERRSGKLLIPLLNSTLTMFCSPIFKKLQYCSKIQIFTIIQLKKNIKGKRNKEKKKSNDILNLAQLVFLFSCKKPHCGYLYQKSSSTRSCNFQVFVVKMTHLLSHHTSEHSCSRRAKQPSASNKLFWLLYPSQRNDPAF